METVGLVLNGFGGADRARGDVRAADRGHEVRRAPPPQGPGMIVYHCCILLYIVVQYCVIFV